MASRSTGTVPKKTSLSKRTSISVAPKTSSLTGPKTSSSVTQKTSATEKPKKEFQLPALSVPYVPKVTESEIEKLRKRHIRRNAPPGEDLKCIRKILGTIRGQDVTVQEFIGLIGPSTGDKGEALRAVMADDLASFRKLARKVYDTITQDSSDVLLNQQMQLSDYYKEKKTLLNNKMMNMIEEIFYMAPTFNFERYAKEGAKYLEKLMPIPEELQVQPEEIEMMKRQAAYHRLQWLRSEGVRLNEENNSLKKRLNQMKRMHLEEQRKMAAIESMAEKKKEALEAHEAQKEQTLEELNQSLEQSIIAQEMSLRQDLDAGVLQPVGEGAVKKQQLGPKKSKAKGKRPKRPQWIEEAAREMEAKALGEFKRKEIDENEPFHFSPIKTPPRRTQEPRQLSPFHYSPPKSPVAANRTYSPPPVARPLTVAPATSQEQPAYRGRRAQAPRDTWGGFY